MFPDLTWIVGLFIGATIGSFLNVVIYRMPRGLSLGKPKNSFCPSCKARLGMADLIPLISWITAGGKCRHCQAKVPARYFWVELVNGALWAGLWYKFFIAEPTGSQWIMGICFMLASAALVAIIFIDGEFFIIPDEINAFLLVVGLVFHFVVGSPMEALWGWLAGWGVIAGIAILGRVAFGRDAMGHGDIKMMRGVGAMIGWQLTLISIMIAVVLGVVFGVLFIALSNLRTKQSPKPEEEMEEEDYPPEPIRDLLILCGTYLIALDVFAIFRPQIYEKMGYPIENINVEEDDWEPTLTTIPFGPYLAGGALACMLFGDPILRYVVSYLHGGPIPTNGA